VVFETERPLVVTRAQLQAAYVSDTENDSYSDRSAQATGAADAPFAVFAGDQPSPHQLYLACDPLLTQPGPKDVVLTLASPDTWQWLNWPISWAYWDGAAWHAVTARAAVPGGSWSVTLQALPVGAVLRAERRHALREALLVEAEQPGQLVAVGLIGEPGAEPRQVLQRAPAGIHAARRGAAVDRALAFLLVELIGRQGADRVRILDEIIQRLVRGAGEAVRRVDVRLIARADVVVTGFELVAVAEQPRDRALLLAVGVGRRGLRRISPGLAGKVAPPAHVIASCVFAAWR